MTRWRDLSRHERELIAYILLIFFGAIFVGGLAWLVNTIAF